MPHDMSDDRPQRSVRSYSGLPALILIAVLIAAVLFVTAGRDDTKVKPATGSARDLNEQLKRSLVGTEVRDMHR